MLRQVAGGEKRETNRKRVLKGGVMAFSARHATLPCVVRDISDTGARLQVQQGSAAPDTFDLIIDLDGLEVPCRVAWRKATEIGVQFLTEPTLVPAKRAQIVTPTGPAGRATMRREVAHGTPLATSSAPVSVASKPTAVSSAQIVAAETKARALPLIPIVVADDDPDDRMLIKDAFEESNFKHPIDFVEDGEQLLRYLRAQQPFENRVMPALVLLDLNMPRMDGRTALMHIKTDASLRRLPIVALTTSNAEEDIQRTYELGVSAYVPKPNTFDGLIELVSTLDIYWSRFARLPTATI